MNLWFRLLWTLLISHWRPRLKTGEICVTPFRVMPTDLDTALHVNNGVYFQLLDLARLDLLIRSGNLTRFRRRRWFPVIGAQTIQYHRALLPFRRFYVHTRWIGSDEHTYFFSQRIFEDREGRRLVAEAAVRALTVRRNGGGAVPMQEFLAEISATPPAEPMPGWIEDWARAMDANRESYKRAFASEEPR
jgi:acyl-CoA thioesterase FadM